MIKFVFDRVEGIVGKGENAGYRHFLLFQQCFQKAQLLYGKGLNFLFIHWRVLIPVF